MPPAQAGQAGSTLKILIPPPEIQEFSVDPGTSSQDSVAATGRVWVDLDDLLVVKAQAGSTLKS